MKHLVASARGDLDGYIWRHSTGCRPLIALAA
jgi:hypothetical protein